MCVCERMCKIQTPGHWRASRTPGVPPWYYLERAHMSGWTRWPPGEAHTKCPLTGASREGEPPRWGGDTGGGEGTGDSRGGGRLKKSTAAWRSSSKPGPWAAPLHAAASGAGSSPERPLSRPAAPPMSSEAEKSPSISMDSSARHVCTAEVRTGLPPAAGSTPSSPDSMDLRFSWAGFTAGDKKVSIKLFTVINQRKKKQTPILTVQNACIKSK